MHRGEIWWADLPSDFTNLPNDFVANVSQVVTIDKSYLDECVGVLPSRFIRLIDEGLRLVLDL